MNIAIVMSKNPLKDISPLPSGLEMNYAYDMIIRRELRDLTINYLVVSFGKSYYVDAALLRGENIYRATRKEKTQNTRRDARQIRCARILIHTVNTRSFRVIVCAYIHRGERTCVSGDAVIDVTAQQTFLLTSTWAFSLSLSLSLSLFLSAFSFAFFTREDARERIATREQELEPGMQSTARKQLLFWQRFLQCHRDENNSQDNYRRASFISRHCSPPFYVSLFQNLRFISAARVWMTQRDARVFVLRRKL